MYGFLRANKNLLEQNELEFYKKMYCGQCSTLQDLFGFQYRILLSYDALFISLLFSSQNTASEIETKKWCAVFPKRVKVISPSEKAQILSACISMSLFSLKLSDSLQEKKSNFKSVIKKINQSKINKANNILTSLGFSKKILIEVLEKQEKAENSLNQNITKYAEPSAYFCGKVFQFTALLNGKESNKNILFEIGYNVGLIIYLVDSSIDILKDIELKKFNALIASYKDDNTIVSKDSSTDVSIIILGSIRKIKELTKQLIFCKNENIVKKILYEGFPTLIINKLINSLNRIKKVEPKLVNYLPHIAIISGLCLFPENAEAKWIWGEKLSEYGSNVYGFACCTGCCDGCCEPLGEWTDCLLNPFVFVGSNDTYDSECITYCCQIPKFGFSGFGIVKGINALYEKNEIYLRKKEAERKRILEEDFHKITIELKSFQGEINSYSQKLKLEFKQDFTDEIHSYFNSKKSKKILKDSKLLKLINKKEREAKEYREILANLSNLLINAENVQKEIALLSDKLGINKFAFIDDIIICINENLSNKLKKSDLFDLINNIIKEAEVHNSNLKKSYKKFVEAVNLYQELDLELYKSRNFAQYHNELRDCLQGLEHEGLKSYLSEGLWKNYTDMIDNIIDYMLNLKEEAFEQKDNARDTKTEIEKAYETLGLNINSTEEEIKIIKKRLSLLYHPDKAAKFSQDNQKLFEKNLKEINEAIDVLNKELNKNC